MKMDLNWLREILKGKFKQKSRVNDLFLILLLTLIKYLNYIIKIYKYNGRVFGVNFSLINSNSVVLEYVAKLLAPDSIIAQARQIKYIGISDLLG